MGFLKRLQAKPEKEKIRILRIAVAVTVILILIIWVLTLRFRTMEKGDTSQFGQILTNIKEFKSKLKK